MNIKVHKEKLLNKSSQEPVCEHANLNLDIYIDTKIPRRLQENLVIHAVIENYCPSWVHDKVDALEGYIRDGLDKLAAARKGSP